MFRSPVRGTHPESHRCGCRPGLAPTDDRFSRNSRPCRPLPLARTRRPALRLNRLTFARLKGVKVKLVRARRFSPRVQAIHAQRLNVFQIAHRCSCQPLKGGQTRPARLKAARRVSLMRVCQPSPLARRAARTSASKRSLTVSVRPPHIDRRWRSWLRIRWQRSATDAAAVPRCGWPCAWAAGSSHP